MGRIVGKIGGLLLALWLVGLFVCPLLAIGGVWLWWSRRRVARVPHGPIAAARDGPWQVEAQAFAVCDRPSPLTGQPCVAATLRVERVKGGAVDFLFDHDVCAPFVMRDEGAELSVDPTSARLSLKHAPRVTWLVDVARGHVSEGDAPRALDEGERARIASLLAARKVPAKGLLRFTERSVASGDRLRVLGVVTGRTMAAGPRLEITDESRDEVLADRWSAPLLVAIDAGGFVASLAFLLHALG